MNPVLLAAAAKSLQSCPTLCDPIDGSPPGSPVPGILQARILEWVAISFSYLSGYLIVSNDHPTTKDEQTHQKSVLQAMKTALHPL